MKSSDPKSDIGTISEETTPASANMTWILVCFLQGNVVIRPPSHHWRSATCPKSVNVSLQKRMLLGWWAPELVVILNYKSVPQYYINSSSNVSRFALNPVICMLLNANCPSASIMFLLYHFDLKPRDIWWYTLEFGL